MLKKSKPQAIRLRNSGKKSRFVDLSRIITLKTSIENKTRRHTSRDSSAKCGAKHARMSIIEKVEIH